MKLLFGKPLAEEILNSLKDKISSSSLKPGLGVILVGDDKASHLYVGLKEKVAARIGFYFEKKVMPQSVTEIEVLATVNDFNSRDEISGIIVQLPLPKGLNADKITSSLDPSKDADGFHPQTIEKFLNGDQKAMPVFPKAIIEILLSSGEVLERRSAALVVNSEFFGKILAKALSFEGIESEIILGKDAALREERLKGADIIVTACGKPKLISGEMIKEGAIIIDGGIENVDGKVVGDVDTESVSQKAGFLAPVPGGVGPLTVACLLRHTAELAEIKT